MQGETGGACLTCTRMVKGSERIASRTCMWSKRAAEKSCFWWKSLAVASVLVNALGEEKAPARNSKKVSKVGSEAGKGCSLKWVVKERKSLRCEV